MESRLLGVIPSSAVEMGNLESDRSQDSDLSHSRQSRREGMRRLVSRRSPSVLALGSLPSVALSSAQVVSIVFAVPVSSNALSRRCTPHSSLFSCRFELRAYPATAWFIKFLCCGTYGVRMSQRWTDAAFSWAVKVLRDRVISRASFGS